MDFFFFMNSTSGRLGRRRALLQTTIRAAYTIAIRNTYVDRNLYTISFLYFIITFVF